MIKPQKRFKYYSFLFINSLVFITPQFATFPCTLTCPNHEVNRHWNVVSWTSVILPLFSRAIFYNPFYLHAICQYNHTPFWKCFIVSCNAAVSSNKNTLNLGSFSESSTFRILCPLLHNQFVIDKDLTMYICVLLFCIIINTSSHLF